jgi:hypothetical protein
MIISNTHRAIFVHILKTAGTSISALFEPHLRWNDLVIGGTAFGERIQAAYQERFGLSKHMRARDIRRVVGAAVWEDYFSFTIVRHPYLRLISFYHWKRATVSRAATNSPVWSWPATEAFCQSKTFSEFIRHEKFLASPAIQPQADWVCDEDGRCIVDFVGRFEELQAAIDTVARRLGFDAAPLGVHNASAADRPPAEVLHREDDYRYLHDFYRRDFELFGYDPALRL